MPIVNAAAIAVAQKKKKAAMEREKKKQHAAAKRKIDRDLRQVRERRTARARASMRARARDGVDGRRCALSGRAASLTKRALEARYDTNASCVLRGGCATRSSS